MWGQTEGNARFHFLILWRNFNLKRMREIRDYLFWPMTNTWRGLMIHYNTLIICVLIVASRSHWLAPDSYTKFCQTSVISCFFMTKLNCSEPKVIRVLILLNCFIWSRWNRQFFLMCRRTWSTPSEVSEFAREWLPSQSENFCNLLFSSLVCFF